MLKPTYRNVFLADDKILHGERVRHAQETGQPPRQAPVQLRQEILVSPHFDQWKGLGVYDIPAVESRTNNPTMATFLSRCIRGD